MNVFDASDWVGATVKQIRAEIPEGQKCVGRVAVVREAVEDENGQVHLYTNDDVWCPARLVEVVEAQTDGCGGVQRYDDEGPTSQPEDPDPRYDDEGGF
jgi:hypothetical protein